MVGPGYARTMARYNAWQNANLYAAAGTLDPAARDRDRGAFFGSIRATLTHLLWADRVWMARIAGLPPAKAGSVAASVTEEPDWDALAAARPLLDRAITGWADGLAPDALDATLTWFSGAAGREVSRPLGLVVMHVFNHQTHHRGQVHAMLTAAGARPADTDLFLMPGT